jgi:hypothetical protein
VPGLVKEVQKMVDIKEGAAPIRREPTGDESAKWMRYNNRIKTLTWTIHGVTTLGEIAESAQRAFKEITGETFTIITDKDRLIIEGLDQRIRILLNQISGVYLKDYGVKFVDGDINIVALRIANNTEKIQRDTYPMDNNLNLGLAPIIIVAGIAAVTILIAGDQATDRLEQKAKIEAIRLQRAMVKADLKMATAPEPQRKQWSEWKKSAAKVAEKAAKDSKVELSFLDMMKQKGSTALILVLLAAAGVVAYSKFGKGRN